MTLQDEKRRLRERNLPAMTPEEEQAFQQKLIDTAAGDANLAQIGSTKTTMKGAKIVNGKYKGLTPAQAQHSAITGTMPPGKYAPGKMGQMSGSLTGDSLPQRPRLAPPPVPSSAPTAAPAPSVPVAPVRPVDPALIEPRGFGAGPVAPPSPAPAGASPSAAIARAYTDNKNMGITGRDANGVQFDSGARIMPGAGGSKTLVSPYGSGSAQFLPPGQKASDPVLAAEIAAIKARQATGTFTNGQGSATPAYAARRNMVPAPQISGGAPAAAPAPAPVPSATPPPAGGPTMLAAPAYPSTFNPSPAGRATIDQGPPKALAGPLTPPAAATSAPATPNGPRLSFGAPKFMTDKPVNGSPIADTMKNNQMIRPGFDKIIAGTQFPVPSAAMPPPLAAPVPAPPRIAPFGSMPKMLSSSPNARPAKTLQPPQLSMSR